DREHALAQEKDVAVERGIGAGVVRTRGMARTQVARAGGTLQKTSGVFRLELVDLATGTGEDQARSHSVGGRSWSRAPLSRSAIARTSSRRAGSYANFGSVAYGAHASM